MSPSASPPTLSPRAAALAGQPRRSVHATCSLLCTSNTPRPAEVARVRLGRAPATRRDRPGLASRARTVALSLSRALERRAESEEDNCHACKTAERHYRPERRQSTLRRELLLGVLDRLLELAEHLHGLEADAVHDGLALGVETREGDERLLLVELERGKEGEVLRAGGVRKWSVGREARARRERKRERERGQRRTMRTLPLVALRASSLSLPSASRSLIWTLPMPSSLDSPPSRRHSLPRTLCRTASPSSPSPGAVNGLAPGVWARESVPESTEAGADVSVLPPAGVGAVEAVNEKAGAAEAAGAAADVDAEEEGGAAAAEPNENPSVFLAASFLSSPPPLVDEAAAGAALPNEKPVDGAAAEPLPLPLIPLPNPKPVFLAAPADRPIALSLSLPWRAAPKLNEGDVEAPNPLVIGGDAAGLIMNGELVGAAADEEEVALELGANKFGAANDEAVPNAKGLAADDDASALLDEAPTAGAPNEKGEAGADGADEVLAAPNENDGAVPNVALSAAAVPSGFLSSSLPCSPSFSPLAILPNAAPNEKPLLAAAGLPAAPSLSGLVGGLTLCPNRSGDGLDGGLVSLAGAILGADGGLSSSRALAGADVAVEEEVEDEGEDEVEEEATGAAEGNENELFSAYGSAGASFLKTKPPIAGALDDDKGVLLTVLPANENAAGGAGAFFGAASASAVRSAIGTGLGGFLKMSGMPSLAPADDDVAPGVRSAMGTGFGGFLKMSGISKPAAAACAGSVRSAIGTGLGGFLKMSGISKAGAAAGLGWSCAVVDVPFWPPCAASYSRCTDAR